MDRFLSICVSVSNIWDYLFFKKINFRSSPVHLIATSKSLHSYARPPPELSRSESGFSKRDVSDSPVRHERVSFVSCLSKFLVYH